MTDPSSLVIVLISFTGKYGWNHTLECLKSIRQFHSEIPVLIVNNFQEECLPQLRQAPSTSYVTNLTNSYELGAIKAAIKTNTEAAFFLILHDSCRLIRPLPRLSDNTIFFQTSLADVAPVLGRVKAWCEQFFPQVQYNDRKSGICQGLMGFFSRTLLLQCLELGLKNVHVRRKPEAVASEALFGLVLQKLCPTIKVYHPHKLDDYMTSKVPWTFLVKLPGGKCEPPEQYEPLRLNFLFLQRRFVFQGVEWKSFQECLNNHTNVEMQREVVLSYFNKNRDALHELTKNPEKQVSAVVVEPEGSPQNEVSNILRANLTVLHALKHDLVTPSG